MVAKVTPIGKSLTETSIDADNDHVSLYGQLVWRVLNLTAYCYSGRAVFNYTYYGRGAGRQFNSFEELELTWLSRLCEKHIGLLS